MPGVNNENTQHDKPHMGYRGIGDEFLRVFLHELDPFAVYDGDQGQDSYEGHVFFTGLGEEW
jgi:hypothetical protein